MLITLVSSFYFGELSGQDLNTLPDTLRESDVFGSRNMKMLTVEGVGEDQRKLASTKDLGDYFNFGYIRKENTEGLISRCLEYYAEKIEDRKVEFDLKFLMKNRSDNNQLSPLHRALKFIYKEGYREKESDQRYKIERYMLILQKDKITPSKIYRAKKAIMMGNPILVELKIDTDMLTASTDFTQLTNLSGTESFSTVLLTGYDTIRGAFKGIIADGNTIWISFDNFMKFVNKGYVIIPSQINN